MLAILALAGIVEGVLLLTGWPKTQTRSTLEVQAPAEDMLHLRGTQTAQAQPLVGGPTSATPTATGAPIPSHAPIATAAPTTAATPVHVRRSSVHPGWTSYTNANFVTDLAFDTSGALWAVGRGGAVRWDPEQGTYTKYTVDDGLAGNAVNAVAVAPDGAVWFCTEGSGVSRFDGTSLGAHLDAIPFK